LKFHPFASATPDITYCPVAYELRISRVLTGHNIQKNDLKRDQWETSINNWIYNKFRRSAFKEIYDIL